MYLLSIVLGFLTITQYAELTLNNVNYVENTKNSVFPTEIDSNVSTYFNFDQNINLLYYKRTNEGPKFIDIINVNNLQQIGFDFTMKTIFIIHGLKGVGNDRLHRIKDEILSKSNVNVIFVDWENFSKGLYFVIRYRITKVSEVIVNFINFLIDQNYSANNIDMIGFSLGAHTAGLTGKNIKQGKIASIIGIDPPSILFSFGNPQKRLSSSDAEVVEVLHGSMFGFTEQIGHMDFYVNGGFHQPECSPELGRCSHLKVLDMYEESITSSKGFVGAKCSDINSAKEKTCTDTIDNIKMGGLYPKKWIPGIFLVLTADKPPYSNI